MNSWGIVPAAGVGSRIQPLAFSKELLPVGSRFDGEAERPRAASEYLIERMIRGGVTNICFVISPGKTDILEYFGANVGPAHICYSFIHPDPQIRTAPGFSEFDKNIAHRRNFFVLVNLVIGATLVLVNDTTILCVLKKTIVR